jgi:hypothetical protein
MRGLDPLVRRGRVRALQHEVGLQRLDLVDHLAGDLLEALAGVAQLVGGLDLARLRDRIASLGVVQAGHGAQAGLEALAGGVQHLADRGALGLRQRQAVGRGQHRQVGRGGADLQILLGGQQAELRLLHDGTGLLQPHDQVLAEDRLVDRQRVALRREGGGAGAEDRVLALDDALARLGALHVQLDRGQEGGLGLVQRHADRAGLGLRRAEARVALAGQVIDLLQRLAQGRQGQQQQRPEKAGTGGKPLAPPGHGMRRGCHGIVLPHKRFAV